MAIMIACLITTIKILYQVRKRHPHPISLSGLAALKRWARATVTLNAEDLENIAKIKQGMLMRKIYSRGSQSRLKGGLRHIHPPRALSQVGWESASLVARPLPPLAAVPRQGRVSQGFQCISLYHPVGYPGSG